MLARCPSARWALAGAFAVALSFSAAADSTTTQPLSNAGPVFGLADDAGAILAADAGAGIVRLRNKKTELVAPLPGISDVAAVNPFTQLAITGGGTGPGAAKLYRVVKGVATQVADLGAFEATVNPDAPEINPNPFDLVALLGGAALVADAGGNSLLYVDQKWRHRLDCHAAGDAGVHGQRQDAVQLPRRAAQHLRPATDDPGTTGRYERGCRTRWRLLRRRVEGLPGPDWRVAGVAHRARMHDTPVAA